MIRWSWLVLACLSLFVYGLGDNSRGPIYPDLLREFSLSDSAGSLFFLVCSAASVLNNVLMIRWIENWGAYRTVQIYTLVQVVAFVLLGFSHQYFFVLVASSVLGISAGGLSVGQNSMASESARPERKRQALSALHCIYGFSSLIAPLLVTLFYHFHLGWRDVFIGLFFTALAVLGWSFTVPGSSPLHSPQDPVVVDPASVGPLQVQASPPSVRTPLGVTAFYASLIAFYVVAEVGLSTRLVLFVRRDRGYDPETANFLLSGFFLGLFLGRLVFALAPAPARSHRILAVSALVSLVTFSLGLCFHPVWLAFSGLAMSVFYPFAIALIFEDVGSSSTRSEAHQAATVVASWSVTAQCLALVFMHYGLGALSDLFSLQRALWLGPFCLLTILGLLFFRPLVLAKIM